MPFFKVRVGQAIGQNGMDFTGGDVIELSENLGFELRDKVDPCLPDGTLAETPAQVTEAMLAGVLDHERISLLEQHVEKARTALEAAEKALAAERARQAPQAQKPPAGKTK